ncbi:MAG: hypothetical protein JNM36_14660 [Chitinophagales bacterium]|jgi:hypothetical protein|nr:hypothetical protein [Chitinophagales bacterium]
MQKVLFLLVFSALLMSCKAEQSILPIANAAEPEYIKIRRDAIATALASSQPILKLSFPNASDPRALAQQLAIADARVQKYFFDETTKSPFLNEVFGVYAVRPTDLPPNSGGLCADGSCYRVEIYNYALNLTTIAMVNNHQKQVLMVNYFKQQQPDIPPHLAQLALSIAADSPEVQAEYGAKPDTSNGLMPATKTALNRSRCERSLHLCVAPTFVKADKALWAIVDLTLLKTIGVRWTNVGTTGERVSERKLQNEKIMSCYCDKELKLDKDDWQMQYSLTRSDGLRVSQIRYKGMPVVTDLKMVDWHVSYSATDGFGYSDAIGCPEFSEAAVVAISAPQVLPLVDNADTVGFVIEQTYSSEGWPTPCNYNYLQRFEFYKDGSFRPIIASIGRGCGNNGTYRPVTRIAWANSETSFYEWNEGNWQAWQQEKWSQQNDITAFSPEKYWAKIATQQQQGYYMVPNIGQLDNYSRGDQAYIYVTKHHPNGGEGDGDLPTIGPCCNTDYHQGPEKFIEPTPEPITNTELVLWYVAQIKNDDTKGKEYCWAESVIENGIYVAKIYPCYSGPKFVPIR